jgi:hypothetical protein
MAFIELLTPVCKGYGSDQALEVTSSAIQVFGGYGYCQEYPVEQYMRDVRIMSIYEGANGIQAIDLVGRKLGMKGGAVLMGFIAELQQYLERAKGHEATKDYAGELEQSVNDLQGIAMMFMGKNMSGELLYVLQQATPFMHFMGHLVVGWLLGEQAIVAHGKLGALFGERKAETPEAREKLIREHPDAAFYDGKIKIARFFGRNLLPQNRALAQAIMSEDKSIMEVVL